MHGCALRIQIQTLTKKWQKYGFFEESSETAHDASARSHRALPNGGTVTKIPRTRAAELVPASPKEVVLKRLGNLPRRRSAAFPTRALLPTRGTAWW